MVQFDCLSLARPLCPCSIPKSRWQSWCHTHTMARAVETSSCRQRPQFLLDFQLMAAVGLVLLSDCISRSSSPSRALSLGFVVLPWPSLTAGAQQDSDPYHSHEGSWLGPERAALPGKLPREGSGGSAALCRRGSKSCVRTWIIWAKGGAQAGSCCSRDLALGC